MNLITVSNVRGFIDENGTAQLNLEDVARGLGFTETKGYYVRWQRVRQYLNEFKFSTCGEMPLDELTQEQHKAEMPDFIPENIFYRLAMKAKNETAEKFQMLIADEILPAIRKTGTYSITSRVPQSLSAALRLAADQAETIELQTKQLTEQKPKVVFAESVECSKDTVLVKGLATILNQNGVDIGQNRLFVWLRDNGYLSKRQGKTFNAPTQKSLDLKIMQEKTTTINKPDREPIVTQTPLITGKGQLYFVNKFLSKEVQAL